MSSYISNQNGPLANQSVAACPKPERKAKPTKEPAKRQSIKPKPKTAKEIKEDKALLEQIKQRDGNLCAICGSPGCEGHHIVPKKHGGRSALKTLVDHPDLRVLLCTDCHTAVHSSGSITPYDFYQQAIEAGYWNRVLLMRLLINDWAKYIPANGIEAAESIREFNKGLWDVVVGSAIPVNDKTMSVFWEQIFKQAQQLPVNGIDSTIKPLYG